VINFGNPGTLLTYPKKGPIRAYLAVAGTITLLALWGIFALIQVDDLGLGERLFGIAFLSWPAFLIGRLTLMYIRRLSRHGPEIIVDEEGLTAILYSEQRIPWDNILRAEISPMAKNIIYLWLVDPTLDPSGKKTGWITRRARKLYDVGDVVFGVEAMCASAAEVLSAIRVHVPLPSPTASGKTLTKIAPPPRR
jgi:hypothetical protein